MTTNAQRGVRRDMARAQEAQKKALTLTVALASKLASVIVHADELMDPLANHPVDMDALLSVVNDPEVLAWLKALGPLAPVKR